MIVSHIDFFFVHKPISLFNYDAIALIIQKSNLLEPHESIHFIVCQFEYLFHIISSNCRVFIWRFFFFTNYVVKLSSIIGWYFWKKRVYSFFFSWRISRFFLKFMKCITMSIWVISWSWYGKLHFHSLFFMMRGFIGRIR